ncbi:MAG: hypothetical protein OEY74_04015 [Gammaproteobacteria bacterium]|nr:hypothetical protein [Gammaproteobacteria bacterium]
MRVDFFKGAILALFIGFSGDLMAEDTDIQTLRAELLELRSDYESRIADLERRLAIAEQNAMQASYGALPTAAASASGNAAFNPAIGVIFTGNAWNYSGDPEGYAVQGFPYGGEAGPISEGLGLGETEIIMNANVDDKFTAWLTAAIAVEDGEAAIELEEAWVETTALPAGFGAKFGRFFSKIGYLNDKHTHTWDFADQPLPYQAFLAGQLVDDGLQLRWLAPTDLYLELGGEALSGTNYPASGRGNSGAGSYSLFANFGGDVGRNSSWLAGVSLLDAAATERLSGDEDNPLFFSGDSQLLTAQFVWKWAADGNWRDRNFVLQAEIMRRSEDGLYEGIGLAPALYDVDQYGWYAQAVYQPVPRWRVGGRIDALSTDNPGPAFDGSLLEAPDSDPRRYSIMADWANSEFSRLRLQYTRDDAGLAGDNQWGLQYIHAIGAHGAHTF